MEEKRKEERRGIIQITYKYLVSQSRPMDTHTWVVRIVREVSHDPLSFQLFLLR